MSQLDDGRGTTAASALVCLSLNDVRKMRRRRDPKRRGLPAALRDDDPTAAPTGLCGLLYRLSGGRLGRRTPKLLSLIKISYPQAG